MKRVTRLKIPGSKKPDLEFEYDASGQRIVKKVIKTDGTIVSTYYLRDATGNVMSVYSYTDSDNSPVLAEQYVYGSSRVGVYTPVASGSIENMGSRSFGRKSYELSDHLGNVRATISDYRKLSSVQIVHSATDYYPFGMIARSYVSPESYRYGYGTQEKDSEIGDGIYGAEYWEYDSRLGRRWNVDPEHSNVPGISPYATFYNCPILFNDPDGNLPPFVWGFIIGAAATTIKLAVTGELKFKDGAWKKTVARIFLGGVSGALVTLAPGVGLQAFVWTGGISMVGELGDQSIVNERAKPNWGNVAKAGVFGMGGFAIGNGLGRVIFNRAFTTAGRLSGVVAKKVARTIVKVFSDKAVKGSLMKTANAAGNRGGDATQLAADILTTTPDNTDGNNNSSNSNTNRPATNQNKDESVTLQLGAYKNESNADARVAEYGGTKVKEGDYYKVRRDFNSQEEADKFKLTVKDGDVRQVKKK